MEFCTDCGTEFADDLEACPACAEAEEVHACARCGEGYRGGDACPACGTLRQTAACELHPDRTASGRCVVCGHAVCGECRAGDGRAHLCGAHRAVTVIEGWAQVYSASNEFTAQLLRDNLKAEGIDARIFSQRDKMFSVDLGELSIVRLLVPVWEYEHARELIREHTDTGGEVAFACPACGEAYELGARECTGCGGVLA